MYPHAAERRTQTIWGGTGKKPANGKNPPNKKQKECNTHKKILHLFA